MEKWKAISNYEGKYEVSNSGKIKSLSRTVYHKRNGFVSVKERILKPAIDKGGYKRVALSNTSKSLKTFKVHRLVASAFIVLDNTSLEVNHINGIKTDNRAENLEWITHAQNVKHSFDKGLQKAKRGELNGNSKLTQKQVNEIRVTYKPFIFGLKRTADKFNVSKRTILDIIKNRTWQTI